MESKEVLNLMDMPIANHIREKIIRQANFAGIDQNLKTGDLVTFQLGDQICQFTFNREYAIEQNTAPDCAAAMQKKDYFFSNKAELTALLGLMRPVTEAVFLKALNDRTYFHNLLSSIETPFLEVYLNSANNTRTEKQAAEVLPKRDSLKTEKILLGFAKSMLKWGKSGFAKVDEETYNKRLKACAGCSLLTEVSNKGLYKLVDGSSGMCASCGCVVSKKALLATDTCPEVSPDNPRLNRWNELHTRGKTAS